jgi:hypothetical protein
MLVFLMPEEVSRNFMMHLLDDCPERLLPERRMPEFDLVSLGSDDPTEPSSDGVKMNQLDVKLCAAAQRLGVQLPRARPTIFKTFASRARSGQLESLVGRLGRL